MSTLLPDPRFCPTDGCMFPPHDGDRHMRGVDDLPEVCRLCQLSGHVPGEPATLRLVLDGRSEPTFVCEGSVTFQTTGPKGGIVLYSRPCHCPTCRTPR